jgi:2-oxoglutarate ferredoxin oxidoreductase subunit alpha
VVLVDSDEHTEEGLITESMRVRNEQNGKRIKKGESIVREAIPPEVAGEGDVAVIGWGSTKHILREALARINAAGVFALHFSWVHPLGEAQLAPLKKARRIIVVENNATGQFAKRLRLQGITVHDQILKSDGLTFFVDELSQKLDLMLKEMR